MSAILAILLMLSSALLFVPHANANMPQVPGTAADALKIGWYNTTSHAWQFVDQAHPLIYLNPPHSAAGEKITVSVWVINVTELFSFSTGFYWDTTCFDVLAKADAKEGGFLSNHGVDELQSVPEVLDHTLGYISWGWSLLDTALAKTGSGPLLNVTLTTLPGAYPYTGTSPGTAVVMADLTITDFDPAESVLLWTDGTTEITPSANHVYDGYFILAVPPPPPPHGPTAAFTYTPSAPKTTDMMHFDGSSSTPGWDGSNTLPIIDYYWDWGDGSHENHAIPTADHQYASDGLKTVTLTVTDSAQETDSVPHSFTVTLPQLGCVLDVKSQTWRYIDPITLQGVAYGLDWNTTAELFRPGDLVQLFATTVYNLDPVQDQLVSYLVYTKLGDVLVAGSARSNSVGLAEIDFRIPWPCTGVETEFGLWHVYVTWEIGTNSGLPPFAKTQNDTLWFNVGWGVWSDAQIIAPLPGDAFYKDTHFDVKYNLHNDYGVSVCVLSTVTVYDDLMVPIGFSRLWVTMNPHSSEVVTQTEYIPKWAFCGTGTVKCDEFTTWPDQLGTAWGPEQVGNFQILHTYTPADP